MGKGRTKKDPLSKASMAWLAEYEAEHFNSKRDLLSADGGLNPNILPDVDTFGKDAFAESAGYADADYVVKKIKEGAEITPHGDGIVSYQNSVGHLYAIERPGKRGSIILSHSHSVQVVGENLVDLAGGKGRRGKRPTSVTDVRARQAIREIDEIN